MKTTQTIPQTKAGFKLLAETYNGRIFYVEYKKKDGSIRKMLARRKVKKGLSGKGMRYNPLSKALMTVFDMNKREYRIINLDMIVSFSVNGSKFKAI